MATESVSILGCGWLGLPLAASQVRAGLRVHGSTTEPERLVRLRELGILAWQVQVDTQVVCAPSSGFFDTQALVLNIPPRRRPDVVDAYPAAVAAVLAALPASACRQIVFVSSTAVYAASDGVVDETDTRPPEKASGVALRAAEDMVMNATGRRATVLRVAGLIGPGRTPGRFLAGKRNVAAGDAPVNLVHRDDVVTAIETVLAGNAWGEIYNIVAPAHPRRRDYYQRAAAALGVDVPTFADDGGRGKTVCHEKAVRELGLSYRHPDPSTCLA